MRDLPIAGVVFVVAMARSLADGIGLADESWFLQVLARIGAGDVLYKDVALGVTPLSVYVTSWITSFTGIEIVAVKVATNACFAATAFVTARIAATAGLSRGSAWTIAAAMLVWGRPHGNPPYTAMALAAFATAAWMVLRNASASADRASRRRWLAAGVACGLSLCAKQNVGLLALVAVVASIVLTSGRGVAATGGVRGPLSHMAAGVALAVAVVIWPVTMSGGWTAFRDYAFAAKDIYVQSASVSYLASLRDGFHNPLHALTVILPIAAAIAVALTWRRVDRLIALFAVAATLTALPRWDRFHMAYAVPFHALAIASALAARRQRRSVAPWHAGLAVTIAVALVLVPAARVLANGYRPSTLDHFRGPLMLPARQAELAATASRLREAAGGRPVFILDTEAGFWYLTAGLANPTPFDIPAATSIGTAGVPWLLSRLADGRIDQVCLDESPPGPLALESVASFVRSRFTGGPDVGPCRLYRSPSASHPNR
jgi:hypothetical protein